MCVFACVCAFVRENLSRPGVRPGGCRLCILMCYNLDTDGAADAVEELPLMTSYKKTGTPA